MTCFHGQPEAEWVLCRFRLGVWLQYRGWLLESSARATRKWTEGCPQWASPLFKLSPTESTFVLANRPSPVLSSHPSVDSADLPSALLLQVLPNEDRNCKRPPQSYGWFLSKAFESQRKDQISPGWVTEEATPSLLKTGFVKVTSSKSWSPRACFSESKF